MIAERDRKRTARDDPSFPLDAQHPAQCILGGSRQEVKVMRVNRRKFLAGAAGTGASALATGCAAGL